MPQAQKVVVRNKWATAEYESLDEAARALSSIGVMTEEEIRVLLDQRVGWINGFAVSYPSS